MYFMWEMFSKKSNQSIWHFKFQKNKEAISQLREYVQTQAYALFSETELRYIIYWLDMA